MSNRSIDEKNILSVDRIEMSDTISQFMEKVNNNFSKIVESGGGPAGTKGDLGNQGVPTKPKVPIHVWKEGEECIESKINDQEFEITRCYEDLTNVKYQEGHIIMLQNGNVYTLEKDDSFNLKPKYVLTLQTYMPGEVVDGKRAFVHIAYADDDNGSGFITESELSNGNYNQEPVSTYNLRRNARAGINVLDKKYMGIYTNHTETPSLDPERYNWIKIQGSDGKVGDMGVSSKIIMIYTSGKHETGEEFIPDKPIGGSYDFNNNEFICPDGWFQTDSEAEPPIWMASRTFTTSDLSTDKEWSKPIRITGENGVPGADGSSIEYIFKLAYELTQEDLDALTYSPENENKYVPDLWEGSPKGIDENNTREWCSIRLKNTTTKKWSKWEKPTIWSQYGLNGQDGDGVQYIYYLTNTATPPKNPTPKGYTTNDSYQDRNKEWTPGVGSYENKDGITLTFTEEDNWSDNPKDISVDKQYQWMACRKYRLNDKTNKMAWEEFSDPTLWSKFGEKGESGTFIRTMYTVSEGTSLENLPDLPKDSTGLGSQWSTEFPTDYRFGENVVWGTTAELKAGTNEFVDETKGWSTPYIVTGTKGVGVQGPKGDPGPAGNPGFDGIPGTSLNILYCLGSEEEPFGDKESWNQNRLEITGWFDILPNPNKIKLTDSNDVIESDILKTPEYLSDNRGRVVYVKDITTEEYTHKHYYINENSELVDLKENNEDFVSYVWAIQGTDIWSRKNDEDEKTGIKWTAPFKLQGTNGIRGVAGADGNRGQVVYPMGVYNYETTYITTDEKAPYVFDNGNYYVLNIIGEWKGSDNANTTPSQNYNHAIENNIKPIWQKFEGFEAIFTKIGIIANGMVGSAVFNNEFMFSQQGINKDGNKTDYAIESGDNPSGNSGFLSGYVYDEKGKDGRHWKYVGTDDYIKDIDVNPYEEKDGTPIHSFRPNVCINFATGQMWLSNGKAVFDQDKTNLTTDVDLSFAIQQSVNEINEDIAKISSEATDVTNSLNDLNEVLSKSLEDGYLSKDEQVRIYSKLSDLNVQFNELKEEHDDLLDNTFLKVDDNTKEEFKDKIIEVRTNLNTSFENLEKSHNMYKHEINTLLGISFETPSTYNLKGDVTNKKFPKINIYEALGKKWSYKYKTLDAVTGNYVDANWDWKDEIPNDKGEIPGFIDFQIKYENDLNNYLKQVLATELFIEEQFKIDIKDNISTQNNLLQQDFEDKLANWNDERLEDLANQITNINGGLDELQKQIDGEVSSYFEPFAPVIVEERKDGEKIYEYDKVILDVEPLKSWLENYTKNESGYYELNSDSDSDSKDELFNNLGDTFTNTQKYIDAEQTPLAGKSWRWCDATNSIKAGEITEDGCIKVKQGEDFKHLHWHRITDTDALRALQMAAEAQATADKKCTLYISTGNEGDRVPDNYNIGDLWILNENAFKFGKFTENQDSEGNTYYTTFDGEEISIGDILNAKEASVTYNVNHWSKQVKYTDDTAADIAKQKADEAAKAAENAKKNADIAKAQLDAIDDDSVISKTEFTTLETQLEQIEAEHKKIVSDCELYGIDLDETISIPLDPPIDNFSNLYYTYNMSYKFAVSALKYHCGKPYNDNGDVAPFKYLTDEDNNIILDENGKEVWVGIDIVSSLWNDYGYNQINIYYEHRQYILNEITKKSREYAESYANTTVEETLNNYTDGINLISARPESWTQKGPLYAPLPISDESDESTITYSDIFSETDYAISLNKLIEVNFNNIYVKIHNENFYAIIIQYDNNYNVINIHDYIVNSAINLLENTKYISVTIKYTGKINKSIYSYEIKDVCIKIERGDKPTPYTLAPEDVSVEVLEAKQEALDVKESFDAVNDVLNKSLEDGKLSKEEVSRIKDSLKSLQKEFKELKQEYDDVIDVNKNPYLVGDARNNLTTTYDTLKNDYDSYYNVLDALTSTEIYKAFDTAFKIDLSSFTFNTKYNFKWNNYSISYESYQNNFTESLKNYTQALTNAQISINEEIQNQAQKYANAAVNGVEVGGTNLLKGSASIIFSRWSSTDATCNSTNKDGINKVIYTSDGRLGLYKSLSSTIFPFDIKGKITISLMIKTSSAQNRNLEFLIRGKENSNDTQYENIVKKVTSYIDYKPNIWHKITLTFELTDTINNLLAKYPVGQGVFVVINQSYNESTDSGNTIEIKNVKIEQGNIATTWTPAPEDIDKEIEEAKKEANEVSTALNSTESLLNKSLEDGYIDANEKEALNKALATLTVEFKDITKEHSDVMNSDYLTEEQKGYYKDYYDVLESNYNTYVSEIKKITDLTISGLLTLAKPKIKLSEQISNWDFTKNYSTPKSNFEDAITNYLVGLSGAQTQMRANLDAETKKNINEAIDNIQVGGVNLLYGSKNLIGRTGYSDFQISNYNGSTVTKTISVDRCYFDATGGTSKEKIFITLLRKDDSRFDTTKEYTFSADVTNTDSSTIVLYIKLSKTQGTTNWQNIIINTNETKHVEFTGYVEQSQYLQLYVGANYGANYNCKFYLSNVQLEYGNKATSWKPNDADIIEAKENILKGGMMLDFNIQNSAHGGQSYFPPSNNTYYDTSGKYLLTKELKPNTEYVFSIEQIILKESSTIPTHISFCISHLNNNGPTTYYNAPYVDKKLNYTFITPNVINDEYYFRIYVGKGSDSQGMGLTYYGIKLAEGNKYTPWEGSADEQKTLMMLNSAMNGSTEHQGGLMLTNTIGMKGSSTDSNSITAGINGLNTPVSGMESDLRFWAGSNTWEDIQNAPFRVYDDGKVYATNFYGFQSATVINKSNYSKYLTNSEIDLSKTGSIIYLDGDLINAGFSISLAFPEPLEEYIGATITIINPHRVRINKCGSILDPAFVNESNAFEPYEFDTLPEVKPITATTYKLGSETYVIVNNASGSFTKTNNWYSKPTSSIGGGIIGGTSTCKTTPRFTYYSFTYGGNFVNPGTQVCSMDASAKTGWISSYTIQVYKLIASPYMYAPDGFQNGGIKQYKKCPISSITGYSNYYSYLMWVLSEERNWLKNLDE